MTDDQTTLLRVRNLANVNDFVVRLIYLLGVHPGRVTSWLRSVAANKAVGGVVQSHHLDGCGADLILDDTNRNTAAISTARALGLTAIDEGDHLHVELDYRKRWTDRTPQ